MHFAFINFHHCLTKLLLLLNSHLHKFIVVLIMLSPSAKGRYHRGSARSVPTSINASDSISFAASQDESLSQGDHLMDLMERILRGDLSKNWKSHCDLVPHGDKVKEFADDPDQFDILMEKFTGTGTKSKDLGKQLLKELCVSVVDIKKSSSDISHSCEQIVGAIKEVLQTANKVSLDDKSTLGQVSLKIDFCQFIADTDGGFCPGKLPSGFHHTPSLMKYYIQAVNKECSKNWSPSEWAG